MIKLTYANINNPRFTAALNKLSGYPGFSIKMAYAISKIQDKVTREVRAMNELFRKSFVDLIEPDPNSPSGYKIKPETREDYDEKFQEFLAIQFEVQQHPIRIHDLEGAGITAQELLVLEPLLIDLAPVENSA